MNPKMSEKSFREAVVAANARRGFAYQLRAMRKARGMNQAAAGELTGKPQTVISRLEDPTYGKVNLQTLLDIAAGFDVGLIVRFVSFSDVERSMGNLSDEALVPLSYDEEQKVAKNPPLPTPTQIQKIAGTAAHVRNKRSTQSRTDVADATHPFIFTGSEITARTIFSTSDQQ